MCVDVDVTATAYREAIDALSDSISECEDLGLRAPVSADVLMFARQLEAQMKTKLTKITEVVVDRGACMCCQ